MSLYSFVCTEIKCVWGWGGGGVVGGGGEENHNTRVEERNVKVKHGKDRGLLSGIKLKLLS